MVEFIYFQNFKPENLNLKTETLNLSLKTYIAKLQKSNWKF